MTGLTYEIIQAFLQSGTIFSKDANCLLIGWGKRKWSTSYINDESPNFYFPDFFLKIGMPWFVHEQSMEISIDEFKNFLQKNTLQEKISWKLSTDFFQSTFTKLQKQIDLKELIKAVPYLFEKTNAKMTNTRLETTLSCVLDYIVSYPAHLYGLWINGEGFLGASPEILFNQTSINTIETVACAGTYFHDEKPFLTDNKLLLEHKIVVDGITSSLHAFGKIQLGEIRSQKFGELSHLITPIELSLNDGLDFQNLVRALHPTPALGAFPKNKGMLWLEQYQMKLPRGRFGAPAGYFFNDQARCIVAIRNVQWDRQGMKIGAGCGVVRGSEFELELKEIKLKLEATKKLLNL